MVKRTTSKMLLLLVGCLTLASVSSKEYRTLRRGRRREKRKGSTKKSSDDRSWSIDTRSTDDDLFYGHANNRWYNYDYDGGGNDDDYYSSSGKQNKSAKSGKSDKSSKSSKSGRSSKSTKRSNSSDRSRSDHSHSTTKRSNSRSSESFDGDRDRDILEGFYYEMCGHRWIENLGWLSYDLDVCAWLGIVCDAMGDVIQIDLTLNNLSGDCSTGDGNLSNTHLDEIDTLTSIRLGGNAFRFDPGNEPGPIPPQRIPLWDYSNMDHLTELDLFGNNLTGSIPSSVGYASSLISLLLSDNDLSGRIPTESLGRLRYLSKLNLGRNLLSGTVVAGTHLCENTAQFGSGFLGKLQLSTGVDAHR